MHRFGDEKLSVPLDVLYDLLAYLAGNMTHFNKRKQDETKRFLSWLAKELKILTDDKDNGFEVLVGKSTIKNYLGDYQKGEEHLTFNVLWEILQKNKRLIRRSLETTFQLETRKEYEKSLSILMPIKNKLAATDWLIDQLVYRLYGLTEDEINVVERKE